MEHAPESIPQEVNEISPAKIQWITELGEKVLTGEFAFGYGSYDLISKALDASSGGTIDSESQSKLEDLLNKIPTAAVQNCIQRAKDFYAQGDMAGAKSWSAAALRNISEWEMKGVSFDNHDELVRDAQALFTEADVAALEELPPEKLTRVWVRRGWEEALEIVQGIDPNMFIDTETKLSDTDESMLLVFKNQIDPSMEWEMEIPLNRLNREYIENELPSVIQEGYVQKVNELRAGAVLH